MGLNLICLLSALVFSFVCQGAEYKMNSFEWGMSHGDGVVGFNDECQVLVSHSPSGRLELCATGYVVDKNYVKEVIEYPISSMVAHHIYPVKINNKGEVAGRRLIVNDKNQATAVVPFVWAEAKGFLNHNLININASYYEVLDLNDLGHFIGDYSKDAGKRPFLCKGISEIKDMGEKSEFSKHFQNKGYYAQDIKICCINSKGQAAGWFAVGYYDSQHKKYVPNGYEAFVWDGAIMHIIPLPHGFDDPRSASPSIKLNNSGTIIVCFNKTKTPSEANVTYLWSKNKGVQPIHGFRGSNLNDSDIIIGVDTNNVPAIWKKGNVITVKNLLPGDDYRKCNNILKFIDINNKGQILCEARVHPDNYIYILDPADMM